MSSWCFVLLIYYNLKLLFGVSVGFPRKVGGENRFLHNLSLIYMDYMVGAGGGRIAQTLLTSLVVTLFRFSLLPP